MKTANVELNNNTLNTAISCIYNNRLVVLNYKIIDGVFIATIKELLGYNHKEIQISANVVYRMIKAINA